MALREAFMGNPSISALGRVAFPHWAGSLIGLNTSCGWVRNPARRFIPLFFRVSTIQGVQGGAGSLPFTVCSTRLSPVAVFTTHHNPWWLMISSRVVLPLPHWGMIISHELVTTVNQTAEFQIAMEDQRPFSSGNGLCSSIYHRFLTLPEGNMNCNIMISLHWWNSMMHRNMSMCAAMLFQTRLMIVNLNICQEFLWFTWIGIMIEWV